jgi:hypothetical protein
LNLVRDRRELFHESIVQEVELVAVKLVRLSPRVLLNDATTHVVRDQLRQEDPESLPVLPRIALVAWAQITSDRLVARRDQKDVRFLPIPHSAVVGTQVVIDKSEAEIDAWVLPSTTRSSHRAERPSASAITFVLPLGFRPSTVKSLVVSRSSD